MMLLQAGQLGPPLNTFGYVSLAEVKFRGFTW